MTTSDAPESGWRSTLIDRLFESQRKAGSSLAALTPRTAFYHYTTADGLKGIIDKGCIWATAASYLNDASEIEYGCTVLEDVFENWEKSNGDAAPLAKRLVKNLRGLFNEPVSKLERATTIYVACFCARNNLLSQWRAYGQVGGYSIGFSLLGKGLESIGASKLLGVKPEKDGYRANLVRVIYDRKDQFAALEDVLKRSLLVQEQPEIKAMLADLKEPAKGGFVATTLILMEHFLMEQIVSFKNKAFGEEHEWRIVVRPSFSRKYWFEGENDGAVHLRSARGLIIPYVKLVPTEKNLPIGSVTIGPSLDKTKAERSVRMLLNQKDYGEEVGIDGSDIPVVL